MVGEGDDQRFAKLATDTRFRGGAGKKNKKVEIILCGKITKF